MYTKFENNPSRGFWVIALTLRRAAGGGRLRRKTITSPDPSDTGDIMIMMMMMIIIIIIFITITITIIISTTTTTIIIVNKKCNLNIHNNLILISDAFILRGYHMKLILRVIKINTTNWKPLQRNHSKLCASYVFNVFHPGHRFQNYSEVLLWQSFIAIHINGLVQERHNSNALAMELHLPCNNPSIWHTRQQWQRQNIPMA